MVTIAGYEIPNLIDELTVDQFDKLNIIEQNKDLGIIEKWVDKWVYLGIPEEVFDDMTLDEFKENVALFNADVAIPDKVLSVNIDGFVYEAKEILGAKDIGLIEKVWRNNLEHFASESLAILFKRADLSRTEHYSPAHLKHKAKLFGQQKAELAVPYIAEILKVLVKSTEDEPTEELERTEGN